MTSSTAKLPKLDSTNLTAYACAGNLKRAALISIAKNLDPREVEELKQALQAIDKDNSGTLTGDEIKEGFKQVGLAIPSETILKKLDADGSASVDYLEFIAATMGRE